MYKLPDVVMPHELGETDGQPWRCPVCGSQGSVVAAAGEDVLSVIHKIERSHKAAAPSCRASVSELVIEVLETADEPPP